MKAMLSRLRAAREAFRRRAETLLKVPLGIRWQGELSALAAGLSVSTLVSLAFPIRFAEAYYGLYETANKEIAGVARILRPGAQMESFASLMNGALLGFLVVTLAMIPLAAYHYRYHFQGSKSIYLMRRLPSKGELARRCLTVPVMGVLLAAAMALLLICLYYLMYVSITPEACLVPGQWRKFWSI